MKMVTNCRRIQLMDLGIVSRLETLTHKDISKFNKMWSVLHLLVKISAKFTLQLTWWIVTKILAIFSLTLFSLIWIWWSPLVVACFDQSAQALLSWYMILVLGMNTSFTSRKSNHCSILSKNLTHSLVA